jgi:hypothetical protein
VILLASMVAISVTAAAGTAPPDGNRGACLICTAAPDDGARGALQLQIDDLNARARAINVQWPGLAVVLLYVGLGNAPSLIFWFVFKYAVTLPVGIFNWLSPTLLTAGIVGGACLVGAILLGVIWTITQRGRRDALVREREELELQLKQLPAAHREGMAPLGLVAAWHF